MLTFFSARGIKNRFVWSTRYTVVTLHASTADQTFTMRLTKIYYLFLIYKCRLDYKPGLNTAIEMYQIPNMNYPVNVFI